MSSSYKDADDLQRVLNDSGFPMQMRIKQHVDDTSADHGWSVITDEYPAGSEGGYTDLLVEKGIFTLIVECKRTNPDLAWLFLLPSGTGSSAARIRCPCLDSVVEGPPTQSEYGEVQVEPRSEEAEFCVIENVGGGGGQKTRGHGRLLEQWAAPLVEAVDAITIERLRLGREAFEGRRAIHIPVIVTTADLQVARIDVDSIGLADGQVAPSTRSERVEFIRFRKSLTRTLPPAVRGDLARARLLRERTVLIVRATALADLLKRWRLLEAEPWPEMRGSGRE